MAGAAFARGGWRWVINEATTITTPPRICSNVHGSCSTTTAITMVTTILKLHHRCGEVHTRDLIGFEVAITADHEVHHADQGHPGHRGGCELRQPAQFAQHQRHGEQAEHADRHGDGHGLDRRSAHDPATHRGIVQRK